MPSRDKVASRPSDRLAWLWLVFGASLLPFGHFQTIWPLAAWLSPVFLMRFSRTRRFAVGLTLIVLAECIGAAVGLRNGFISAPVGTPAGPVLAGGALIFGSLFSLPFGLDRAYYLLDAGEGVMVSTSVSEHKEAEEQSNWRAGEFVAEHLAPLLPNPPQVTSGEVEAYEAG